MSVVRGTLGLLTLLVIAGCTGCAVSPPRAEKYFDRSSAMQCVKMFQYCIEAEQFDTAYLCLTEESQEILPRSRLWWVLDRPIDELGGLVTLRQLITEAEDRFWIDHVEGSGRAVIAVLGPHAAQDLHVLLVDEEWLIDLPATLRAIGLM